MTADFRKTIRGTLERMVDAGRLESVPGHEDLFRLGGVVRKLSEEGSMTWAHEGHEHPDDGDRVGAGLHCLAWQGMCRMHSKRPGVQPGAHKSCLLCVLLCLTRAPGPGRTMTWAWAIHRHRPGGVLGLRVGGLGL